MDSGIANIIATSVSSLVSLIIFIGTSLLTKTNYDKPAKIKIYEKQLVSVLEPLEKIYDNDKIVLSEDILKETRRIIYKHFALVPVQIFGAYKSMLNDMDNSDNFYIFRDTVTSHYNWVRKKLSFPNDTGAITLQCLEPNDIIAVVLNYIKNSALFATSILLLAVMLSILDVYIDTETAKAIKVIFAYIGFTFAIFLFLTLLSSPMIRKRGLRYKKLEQIKSNAGKASEKKGLFDKFVRFLSGENPRDKKRREKK